MDLLQLHQDRSLDNTCSLAVILQGQYHPRRFLAGIEIFCIRTVQHASPSPHVADEHLKCSYSVTEEMKFSFQLILTDLNLNSHRWLVVTVLDHTRLT